MKRSTRLACLRSSAAAIFRDSFIIQGKYWLRFNSLLVRSYPPRDGKKHRKAQSAVSQEARSYSPDWVTYGSPGSRLSTRERRMVFIIPRTRRTKFTIQM